MSRRGFEDWAAQVVPVPERMETAVWASKEWAEYAPLLLVFLAQARWSNASVLILELRRSFMYKLAKHVNDKIALKVCKMLSVKWNHHTCTSIMWTGRVTTCLTDYCRGTPLVLD